LPNLFTSFFSNLKKNVLLKKYFPKRIDFLYIFLDILFYGERMKDHIKEKIIFGTVFLVIAMLLMGPMVSSLQTGTNLNQQLLEKESILDFSLDAESNKLVDTIGSTTSVEDQTKNVNMPLNPTIEQTERNEDEKTYEMRIGPYVIELDMTEHQAYLLKKEIETIAKKSYNDPEEQFSEIIEVLHEYNIVPEDFTIENIKKILYAANYDEQGNGCNLPRLKFGETYNTFGPHFMCYISLFGMAVPFPYGVVLTNGSVNRVIDLLNITNENISAMIENLWIMNYWMYATTHFLVGGPLGFYFSMSVLPTENNCYSIFGPFFGVYCPIVGLGIYIYQKNEPGIEVPLIDIFFAFSLFSVVQEVDT